LCFPCLVRRAALDRAGVSESKNHYAFALRTILGRPNTYDSYPIFNSVRFGLSDLLNFCRRLGEISPSEFACYYTTEIATVVGRDGNPSETVRSMHKLYQDFAFEVIKLVGESP
jgi:hypothetical protein